MAGALLLTGCEGGPFAASGTAAQSPSAATVATREPLRLAPPNQSAKGADNSEKESPANTPSIPGVALFEKAALVGLAPDQAKFLLGAPTATRSEPPATVWIYRVGDCAVNLYFYASVETTALKVLALDVTASNDTNEAQDECYNKVVSDSHDRR